MWWWYLLILGVVIDIVTMAAMPMIIKIMRMMMIFMVMMIFTFSSTWFVLTSGFLEPTELHWDSTLSVSTYLSRCFDHDDMMIIV